VKERVTLGISLKYEPTLALQAAQCEMGLNFYCKFKQNQEMTKIAFVSFQFKKNFQQKFTLKILP
jgi:hypothetical protein